MGHFLPITSLLRQHCLTLPSPVLLLPSAPRPAAPVRLPQFQALTGQAHTCPSPTSQWPRPGIAFDCPGALVFCVQCMVLSLFPCSLQLCRASPFRSATDHIYDMVPGDSITQWCSKPPYFVPAMMCHTVKLLGDASLPVLRTCNYSFLPIRSLSLPYWSIQGFQLKFRCSQVHPIL